MWKIERRKGKKEGREGRKEERGNCNMAGEEMERMQGRSDVRKEGGKRG